MEWSDQAIVLSTQPQGETSAIAMLLTREHGRHRGLARGARSPRKRSVLQAGNVVAVGWRAKLAEQLGQFTIEPIRGHAAQWFDDPLRLAALSSACAMVEAALPEREPHPALYLALVEWLELLGGHYWGEAYVRWEIGLLAELGYGLDLERCALSGRNDGLAYVSPRSGRAVSLSAAEPYRDRLLPLPGFLVGAGGGGRDEIRAGLALTGHFLERQVFTATRMPPARQRLIDRLDR